ncbi:hypothetical protein Tco_0639676, partial [Tanacetum coccineum]
FEDRVKSLEDDFLEFKQTNLFAEAVSLITGIIDKYLANKMNEAVKAAVQLQIKKTINEELKAEVLTRSSNEAKTSHAVAAKLYELELKKILIDKIKSNKSIHRSILSRLKDVEMMRMNEEEPSPGSNRGSKRKRARKETELTSAPKEKTSKSIGKSKEGSKSQQKSTDKSAQA